MISTRATRPASPNRKPRERSSIVSTAANRDLADIYDHIAEQSGRAAYRMIGRFYQRFAQIAESPELGRSADDLQLGLRRMNEDGVEIARVNPGMRDLPEQFR